jgi:hypothetical protein
MDSTHRFPAIKHWNLCVCVAPIQFERGKSNGTSSNKIQGCSQEGCTGQEASRQEGCEGEKEVKRSTSSFQKRMNITIGRHAFAWRLFSVADRLKGT